MPDLERPDGIRIHWDERGAGPCLVAVHNSTISMPSNLDAVLGDLSTDHRVVTTDPRGTGSSTRTGPYDLDTDAGDLAAVMEAAGAPATTVVFGFNPVPMRVASTRPELIELLVLAGEIPRLGAAEADEVTPLLDSDSVIAGVLTMMRNDPRALLRSMITMGNDQLNDGEVRARLDAQLDYCPAAVAVARGEAFLGHDDAKASTALGDRLWIVHWENQMTSIAAARRASSFLPKAHLIEIEDGPITRPELTAAAVRRATASVHAG